VNWLGIVSNYGRGSSLFEAVTSLENIFVEAQYICAGMICVSAVCSGADVSTAEAHGTSHDIMIVGIAEEM
jgi:hypothetical protein